MTGLALALGQYHGYRAAFAFELFPECRSSKAKAVLFRSSVSSNAAAKGPIQHEGF